MIPLGGNAQAALAVLDGRAGKPAFAGAAEVAGVGETEQEADFGDAVFAVRQQVVGDVFPFPVKQGVKGMPFFFQAALQGARGEIDVGGDIGQFRFALWQQAVDLRQDAGGEIVFGELLQVFVDDGFVDGDQLRIAAGVRACS